MPFPPFSYHPDPRGTGVIVESDADCLACGQFRGYIYRGPVYSGHEEELSDALCPWCIADGTAGWSPAGVEEFLDGLDKDGDHTAYLFACRHCGVHLAYSDSA